VCVCVCVCVDEQGDGPLWTCGKMRAPKRGNFSKVTDRSGKQTGEAVAVGTLKVYMGSRVTAPLILNFCTRYRWVVNITLRPLYPRWRTAVPCEQVTGRVSLDNWRK